MKKNILLDIDGVLANFYSNFAVFLNLNYGCVLNPLVEPLEYDFDKWQGGVEKINLEDAISNWLKSGRFLNLAPFDGAKNFVDELEGVCNIFVVTARIGDWYVNVPQNVKNKVKIDTRVWLRENGFPYTNLYFRRDKVDFCAENNISIMIEDKLQTALLASKNKIDTVLMNRGYNYAAPQLKIHRAYNFDDAIKTVRALIEK